MICFGFLNDDILSIFNSFYLHAGWEYSGILLVHLSGVETWHGLGEKEAHGGGTKLLNSALLYEIRTSTSTQEQSIRSNHNLKLVRRYD